MKEDLKQNRSIPIGIVAGVCAVIVAVGGGITYWINSQPSTEEPTVTSPTTLPSTSASPPPLPTPSPAVTVPVTPPSPIASPSPISPPSPKASTPPAAQPIQTNVALYWVRQTAGGDLDLVPMEVLVRDTKDPEVVLATAFNRLLTGSPDTDTSSSIPEGTQLLNIAVQDDGIYLNLSKEFTNGGGSASMISRLGQVIYTATSLESDANVWLYVDGEPLELLGGEGLEIPQPTTRDNFIQEFQF